MEQRKSVTTVNNVLLFLSQSNPEQTKKLDWDEEIHKVTAHKDTELIEDNDNEKNIIISKEMSGLRQSISDHLNLVHNKLLVHFTSIATKIEENVQNTLMDKITAIESIISGMQILVNRESCSNDDDYFPPKNKLSAKHVSSNKSLKSERPVEIGGSERLMRKSHVQAYEEERLSY